MASKKIIFIFAVIFLFLYWWLPASTPLKFNSPDETANYFWARQFAAHGVLYAVEPLNLMADNLIHPRSMTVIDGFLLPGSFLGLPLVYGFFGKIFGLGIVPFLTGVITILGALALYSILSGIWGQRNALASFFLFLIHPAIFYYTSREFFHNVQFVCFLLFASFFYLRQPIFSYHKHHVNDHGKVAGNLDYAIGALLLGIALLIRTSEVIWVAPLVVFLFMAKPKGTRSHGFHVTLGILVCVGIFLLTMNQSLYGSFFRFGYTANTPPQVSITDHADTEVTALPEGTFITLTKNIFDDGLHAIFPFGIHPRIMRGSIWTFFIKLMWWFSIPMFLGLFSVAVKYWRGKLTKHQKIYMWISMVAAAYLFISYGSFSLQDNPTPDRITVASSYLRYWLPAFVLLLPYASHLILYLQKLVRSSESRTTVVIAAMLFMSVMSFNLTFFGLDDGLLFVRRNVWQFESIRDRVMQLTSKDSVIVVDRADKVFFPDRRVIYPLRDNETLAVLPKLARLVPLYYYGVGISMTESRSLGRRLKAIGLKMERVEIFDKEALYRISNF